MSKNSGYTLYSLPSGVRTALLGLLFFFVMTVSLQTAFCQSGTMKPMDMGEAHDTVKSVTPNPQTMNMADGGGMDMVHPFFTHMGVPDPVGHFALRLSGVAGSVDGNSVGDFGFHLETGLAKRLGLHIRNDKFIANAHTEISLQYAVIESGDGMSGISPFVELEIPTRSDEPHTYGLVGFSTMWSSQMLELNQSLEYSPKEAAIEGSASLVANIGYRFFPIVEFTLAGAKGEPPHNSVIGGLKYRINQFIALGLAYQVPVTEAKDFSHQILLQSDVEW